MEMAEEEKQGQGDVEIGLLKVSNFNLRRHQSKEALNDLRKSIMERGILTPLLVRPVDGVYEIAAGHRRFQCAKELKLEKVPVVIKPMTDEEILEIILIENLQREDIHPLDEAEGFYSLMKMGMDAESVAVKVGKSESYVYHRMKLRELTEKGKKLFYEGKLSPGHTLLISRLQPKDQDKALKECFEQWNGERALVSLHTLRNWIERNIYLDLNSARFKKEDENLVPDAGTCAACPKRSGFNKSLFDDIQKQDICTDRGCFGKKMEAFLKKTKETLDDDVINLSTDYYTHGKDVLPTSKYTEIRKGDERCGFMKKGIVVEGQDLGKVIEVCIGEKCRVHHPGTVKSPEEKKKEKKERDQKKIEQKTREAIFNKILEKIPDNIGKEELRLVARCVAERLWGDHQRQIAKRRGFEATKKKGYVDYKETIDKYLDSPTLKPEEIWKFLLEMVLIQFLPKPWDPKKDELLKLAKQHGINPKKIEKEAAGAAKERRPER